MNFKWIVVIVLCSVVILFSCNKKNEDMESSLQADIISIDSEEEAVETGNGVSESEVQNLEGWALVNNANWYDDYGFLSISKHIDSVLLSTEIIDFYRLYELPNSELARIRALSISGTNIYNTDAVDFSRFSSLIELSVSHNNLKHLNGLENTPIEKLGLYSIPITDIQFISTLTNIKRLSIRSTEYFEIPEDLSMLTSLITLNLEAPGMSSMEGIKTITNPFVLNIFGTIKDGKTVYPDIEVLRAVIGSKVSKIVMHFETEQMYGEALKELIEEGKKYNPDLYVDLPGL